MAGTEYFVPRTYLGILGKKGKKIEGGEKCEVEISIGSALKLTRTD